MKGFLEKLEEQKSELIKLSQEEKNIEQKEQEEKDLNQNISKEIDELNYLNLLLSTQKKEYLDLKTNALNAKKFGIMVTIIIFLASFAFCDILAVIKNISLNQIPKMIIIELLAVSASSLVSFSDYYRNKKWLKNIKIKEIEEQLKDTDDKIKEYGEKLQKSNNRLKSLQAEKDYLNVQMEKVQNQINRDEALKDEAISQMLKNNVVKSFFESVVGIKYRENSEEDSKKMIKRKNN